MSLATSNAFALLKASKSKKEDKGKDDKEKRKGDDKKSVADLEKAIFSQPSMGISNWADEDDDDYAMPSLPIDWDEVSCGRRGGNLRVRAARCAHLPRVHARAQTSMAAGPTGAHAGALRAGVRLRVALQLQCREFMSIVGARAD